jgi:membrane-associated phospholipid phosphatase
MCQSARSARAPVDLLIASYLLLTAPVLLFDLTPTRATLLGGHVTSATFLLGAGRSRIPRAWLLRWPQFWRSLRQFYPLVLMPLLYWEVPLLSRALYGATYFDATIIGWEQALFDTLPSQTWATKAPYLWLSELLHAAYLSYYFIVSLPPLILFLRWRDEEMSLYVFIFLLVSLLHCVIFIAFPVQGPRYLFPPPTAGRIEHGPLYWLTHWILQSGSSQGTAFPSAHVSVSCALAVAARRVLPRWWLLLLALSVLVAVATVYGGFHYLVDALVGAAVGLLVALLTLRLWPAAMRDDQAPVAVRAQP